MALAVEGGGPPLNHGEKVVLEALVSQLGDDVRIIPNWTVVHQDRLDECDAIVVTRDAVFIVETKFLVGDVEVGANDFWVDGSKRTHPYHLTHQKAQRLRTKLNNALPWFGSQGRVEAQVVLAVRPRSLEVDELMKGRFIGVPAIGATLNSPSDRVFPQQVGRLSGRIDEVVKAITGAGIARQRDKHLVHGYRIDEVIYENSAAGYFRAIGTNRLANVQHVLEVFQPLTDLSEMNRKAWRMEKTAPFRFAALMGAHGCLLSPTGVDEQDDGSVVLVWPMLGETALKVRLDLGVVPTGDEARVIVRDISSALAHIHASGSSHRAVDPIHCAVRADGRGILRFGDKLIPQAVGQVDDLKSLGGLVKVLADSTSDARLAEIATELLSAQGPQIDAAAVADRLTDGAAQASSGGTPLSELFADLEPLATGTTASVFAGTDAGGARVAVKVLPGADSTSPDTWREYRLLAGLDHPSIVRTLTAGFSDEGPYMVTELLDGTSLVTMDKQGRELGIPEKLAIAMQLLSALSSMHPNAREIARLMKTGDPEDAALADDLRIAGVVHNDISPTNVRWIEGRGAVLFDFDMAGRLDSYVGGLSKPYRPGDVAADVAIPDADIYAVGALLHELLTGTLPYEFDDEDRRIVCIDEKIDPELREVLRTACAASSSERFETAEDFLDSLVAAGIEAAEIGGGDDKLERIYRINELVREGEFDAALELCDDSWTRLRARIEEKRAKLEAGSSPILVVNGVELRYVGTDSIGPIQSANNKDVKHEIARAEKYSAVFPDGGILTFALIWDFCDGTLDLWMAALDELHCHPRIARLVKGLRMGSKLIENDPARVALRLWMAIPGDDPDWPSKKQSVTVSEMAAASGFDIESALLDRGAINVGTMAEVAGETNRNRNNLAVLFEPFSEGGRDAAAIAYFASRVMALWRTIEQVGLSRLV